MLGLYVGTLSPVLAAAPVLLCHAPEGIFPSVCIMFFIFIEKHSTLKITQLKSLW